MSGVLQSVDQYLNVKLDQVQVLEPERFPHLITAKNCFIRGSTVRYIQLNPKNVDTELLHNATRKEMAVPPSTIPTWLKGTLVRNGPGLFSLGDTSYNHWFDGLAYIQKYAIENGKMKFQAKYLKSDAYNENMRANRIIVSEFGTTGVADPCKSIFQRFFNFFFTSPKLTDNGLVSFIKNGDKVFAVTETPYLHEINLNDLETLDKVDITKYIAVHSYTAHCHYDKDENIYNIGSIMGRNGMFAFIKTTPPKEGEEEYFKRTEIIGRIPMTNPLYPPYYHSFGFSENYIVLIESPLRINVKKVMIKKFTGRSTRECFDWLENTNSIIHILDKRNGERINIKIEVDPFFTFHHANSYEVGDFIVIDYCSVKNPELIGHLNLEEMREGKLMTTNEDVMAFLHRLILPTKISKEAKVGDDLLESYPDKSHSCEAILLNDGKVKCKAEILCDIPFEFPQFNYSFCGTKSRYVYGAIVQKMMDDNEAIIKVDTRTKEYKVWKKDKKSYLPTEPIFVPSPNGIDEDDGVVIAPIVTNYKKGDKSFVVFLDAKTMNEIGRSYITAQLPLGFHALYVDKN
uniref:Sm domain-containing protein n=1 Tax=Parastrongyloides trichosuri TaxID=131310 RepID=A0A0N4Z7P6_PARTI